MNPPPVSPAPPPSPTCEVANSLQLQGLQDGFKGRHLQINLLIGLHGVVIYVCVLRGSLTEG